MSTADLFSLAGRVALVTGASSGIGNTIARALCDAGAALVLLARRAAELERTRAELVASGGRAAAIACDLTDRAALAEGARAAAQAFGAPDILVNAAGTNRRKPIFDLTDEDWDYTMRLNLDAPFFLSRLVAPPMIERGWGRIINIASLQTARAFPDSAPYGASKAGIAQLTRAQAQAWSRFGVTANAIAPGFFPTELTAAVVNDPVRWKQMAERTFVGRNGALDDLRGTAIYLASRASDYVTGQVVYVDGGFSAG